METGYIQFRCCLAFSESLFVAAIVIFLITTADLTYPQTYSRAGKWAVLFSHPSDFTPVCTTEIAAIAAKNPELKECDCLLIGLSVDSAESHQAWVQDIVAHYQEQFGRELQESELDFPIIADSDRNVANLFGMIDDSTESNVTIRTVFIIDPDHRLRLNLNYPASVGRNVNEIVRCIKVLQLSYQKSVATPENWPHNHPEIKLEDGSLSRQFKGSVFLLPTVTTEQAFLNYPRYHTCEVPSQKKYLRLVQASHVGVDASSASMGSTDEDHNSYNTNGAVMSSKKSNGDGEIPNGNNNKATKREDKGTQTVEEPFQWPWERHDPVYDSKIASAKDQTTTSAQGEPFRWPWESSESTSDESAPKRHIASKGGNKTEDRLVAKKGELLFKWPWEKNSGGWKWPWEEDDQK